MKPPLFVRELTAAEREALRRGLRSPVAFTLRRSQVLLASAAGQKPSAIATALGCATQTVRDAIRAFHADGAGCLAAKPTAPKTTHPAWPRDRDDDLKALLHQSPRTLGKPTGTAATLSQSDLSALVSRIKSCLRSPLGAREAGAKANLTIRFNPDGSVKGQPEITEMGVTSMDLAWANASVRAVMTCGPYDIVAQKYDQLNEIGVLFDATKD